MSARSPHDLPYGFLACTFSACVLASLVGACAPNLGTQNSSAHSSASLSSENSSASSSAAGSTEATSHAGLSPLGNASLERHEQPAKEQTALVVTSVRAASHHGFDRIVFEATGSGEPGWFCDYTDNPSQQASGNPIEVPGDTALEVLVTGTTYPFELGLEDPQIGRVEMNTELVTDVLDAGSFEGQTQFVIGIKGERRPYSVQVLENPTRVVIDILHN